MWFSLKCRRGTNEVLACAESRRLPAGGSPVVEISCHTLRDTFGTQVTWRKGVDLVTVVAMIGHESLGTTAIHIWPGEEDMAEGVQTLSGEQGTCQRTWIRANRLDQDEV